MTRGWSHGLATFSIALTRASDVPKQIALEIKDQIQDDLKSNFDAERDPYGQKWAPRKKEPKDGHAVLYEKGNLYRSGDVNVKKDGVLEIRYGERYSVFHQGGTRRMAQRLLVPLEERGMPDKWTRLVKDAFKRALEDLFARGGFTRKG